MRRLLLIPLLLAAPLSMTAQRAGFAHFSGRGAGFNRSGFGRSVYYPIPFFDSFYSGDGSDVAYPGPQPIVFMMQGAPVPAVADPAPPVQPLIIELQGDRYVQVSGDGIPQAPTINRAPAPPSAQSAATSTPPPQLASTILVFRDGRRQEVSAYTIAGGTLYAAADYYNSGAWNEKIPLSSLKMPETIAANQSRGVQFRVPTAPNEVIVGP
jgi:hypothetical protein